MRVRTEAMTGRKKKNEIYEGIHCSCLIDSESPAALTIWLPRQLNLRLYFNHDFSYILKTDDDSVINIAYLLQKLQEDSQFDSTKAWIWSQFRKNWPLNYIGKWADYDYQSPYYPTFPCGAAYVMSQKTTLWLIANAELLHTYQGEDVSIGIWLSAINPNIIE
ncbi:UDP-GalNAc:beta-1, 3-N-acetylgalactosaminyltransferase 2, partial [Araneus ventricosus]